MKRCHKCKGTDIRKVRDRFVDKFLLADGRTLEFVFEDFPQKVCSSCDERYYEAKDLIAAEDAVTRDLMARGIRDSAVFKYLRKAVGLKATELADLRVTAVARYMVRERKPPSPSWREVLDNHVKDLVAIDFFAVPTA